MLRAVCAVRDQVPGFVWCERQVPVLCAHCSFLFFLLTFQVSGVVKLLTVTYMVSRGFDHDIYAYFETKVGGAILPTRA